MLVRLGRCWAVGKGRAEGGDRGGIAGANISNIRCLSVTDMTDVSERCCDVV